MPVKLTKAASVELSGSTPEMGTVGESVLKTLNTVLPPGRKVVRLVTTTESLKFPDVSLVFAR